MNNDLNNMRHSGEYIIQLNRSKMIKELLLLLLLGLAVAIFIVFLDMAKFRELIPADSAVDNFVDAVLMPVAKFCAYIMIAVCILCLINCIKNISSSKNLLFMNELGFEENISKQPLGFVRWCDVEELMVKPFFTAKIYAIKLKTPEKYNIKKKNTEHHIMFSSQYFIDQSDEVEAIIKYHVHKSNADTIVQTK